MAMKVTSITFVHMDRSPDKFLAFCSVVLDGCLTIHDIKIFRQEVRLGVSMPGKKKTDVCPACQHKNHLLARYCNHCGQILKSDRAERLSSGKYDLHTDLVYPSTPEFREYLVREIVKAYAKEKTSGEPHLNGQTTEEISQPEEVFGVGI